MHIMEGFLPVKHAVGWTVISAPFVLSGIRRVRMQLQESPESKLLLSAAGAYAFVLSALKLPSATGSSSHPTGLGLGSILFGPQVMSVIGMMTLLFQALLLAHGGLTTLGANTFSMAIVGPWTAYAIYSFSTRLGLKNAVAVFAASAVANIATYLTTAFQLALAFPDADGGITGAFTKFIGIFALTQIPLALIEGALTVGAISAFQKFNTPILNGLAVKGRN